MENDQLATGEVELGECVVEVLSEAETPPLPIEERARPREGERISYAQRGARSRWPCLPPS